MFNTTHAAGARTGDDDNARRMAERMSGALLAFARNGRPVPAGIPHWPPYTLAARETMIFDDECRVEPDPRGGERRLYGRVPFVQRGTT